MRKKVIILICFILISVLLIFDFNRNKMIMSWMTNRMVSVIRNDSALELLEVKSTYGKLNGNGNGIQYFAAALVLSRSEADVEKCVEQLAKMYEVAGYSPQYDSQICSDYLEHRKISFQHSNFSVDGMYYQIFFYCSHHMLSNESSVLGH